ncbi:MAG: hypothetical protein B7Z55_07615 [Planctomycetales bacterium 12-60-4]|nr:MAG: hypothetical protein B7Z55_07615 [Planctomycetales bacterium 12-60-4]
MSSMFQRSIAVSAAMAILLPAQVLAGWTIQGTTPTTTGTGQIGQNTGLYGWGYATPSSSGLWAFGIWNDGAGTFTSEGQDNVTAVYTYWYGWMLEDTIAPFTLWTLSPTLPYGILKPDHKGRASGANNGIPWEVDTLTFVVVP